MADSALPAGDAFERRRVGAFLLVAFGIAVLAGVVIHVTGGLTDSPRLVPGLPVTLATVLTATVYMFSPAIAHLLARAATGEGWDGLLLRPRLRERWRTYLLAWLGPAALIVVGSAIYFVVFPGQFDPGLTALRSSTPGAPAGAPSMSPEAIVAIQVVAGLTVGPLVNTVFAFGEEFGWRAYLLPKLLALGTRPAVVLHGAIWGAWHWPIVAMGYNYGLDYPGAPWVGFAAMVWATVGMGVFLAWVTVRSGSVWPAALGHGTINAFGAIGFLVLRGEPHLLLGPGPVGAVAVLPWIALGAWLLVRDEAFGNRPPISA